MNRFEHILNRLIQAAVHDRLLHRREHPPPITVQNAVLEFFVRNAHQVADLSEPGLLALVDNAILHPDWQDRARAAFISPHRNVWPRPVPKIVRARPQPPARTQIISGLCQDVLPTLAPGTFDLVLTSPPYAQQRQRWYGGMDAEHYPEWFAAVADQVRPLLTPNGSMMLILAQFVHDAEQSDFVDRTMALLRDRRIWIRHRDQLWYKADAPPLGDPRLTRNSFEPIYWMSLGRRPFCNPWAGGTATKRSSMTSVKGLKIGTLHNSTAPKRGFARRSNVFCVPVSSNDRSGFNSHPAAFPVPLAVQLLDTFCPPGGRVLDPFAGSGPVAVAAEQTGRTCVGIEAREGFCHIARKRLALQRRSGPLSVVPK